METQLKKAITASRQFFFNHQHPDGYWVGELEGDALLQSETIMLLAFLGEAAGELAAALARHLVETQLPGGGWNMYTGGKADVNNTVKGYFALKLTGHNPAADYMQKARKKALELGGADKVNSFTRFYLAALGQIPYHTCPAVPPQMMLLPKWSPMTIYSMSSWSRTIFVPLSIVSALQPVRQLPQEKGIRELFVKDPSKWAATNTAGKKRSITGSIFKSINSLMLVCRRFGITPFRQQGIEAAKQWTLEHCKDSDGPGAIYPPIIWGWIAFKALGYGDDTPEVQYFRQQLNDLVIWTKDRTSAKLQPCKSPVWDTALTLKALMLGGLTTDNPAVKKGVQWIRSRQLTKTGDWGSFEQKHQTNNGWCFEFNNAFYPDNDDTAMALMVLAGRFDQLTTGAQTAPMTPDLRLTVADRYDSIEEAHQSILDTAESSSALDSGLRWLLSMQNKDGGWAAFDRDNNLELLCKVPFADHNAMIDPSTPDLTGRVMESLGRLGYRIRINPEVDRVVKYMRSQQLPDGSWFGRWGVNYIYGTWQALTGLTAVGVPADDPAVQAGANWLLTHQYESGGWGESPDSYEKPETKGQGTPTASQTAWAVMGLLAANKRPAGERTSIDSAIERGIRFLLNTQRDNGTWNEPEFTGTGFPLVFYLKYHYYSVYFPLMALSMYAAQFRNDGMCRTPIADDEETVLRLHRLRIFSPETEYYNNVIG